MEANTVVEKPPVNTVGPIAWVRKNLFSGVFNSVLTILATLLFLVTIPPFIQWAFIDSLWSATPDQCRQSDGACWAFVQEKFRFILFGTYTYDEQWRPALSVIWFVSLLLYSRNRGNWNSKLGYFWAITIAAIYTLMSGGVLGLTHVENNKWGGLPLTMMLATGGVLFAYPLGILLALGRRSQMVIIKVLCSGYIELIRGVPLISLLFMSSVMFPLFLPEGMVIEKLLRAQVAIILFTAAYLAEVVRGGLQAIPKGQYEAADALGLGFPQKMTLIILPQALKIVIPPTVSVFISVFKDTTLVVIISMYDLLGTAKASMADPKWVGFSSEGYIFLALIFFTFCFSMAKYSMRLERELHRGHKR